MAINLDALSPAELQALMGSTPSPRTLRRSLMMRQEGCHGTAKKVYFEA